MEELESSMDPEGFRAKLVSSFLESELDYLLNLQNTFKVTRMPHAPRILLYCT